jgi:hypothetical protein
METHLIILKSKIQRNSSMVKIKVSYQCTDELKEVLKLLSPQVAAYKVSKKNDGTFRKAYIELKDLT